MAYVSGDRRTRSLSKENLTVPTSESGSGTGGTTAIATRLARTAQVVHAFRLVSVRIIISVTGVVVLSPDAQMHSERFGCFVYAFPWGRIRISLGPGPGEEGGNISKSLAHLSPGVDPPPRFESVEGDSGNGSLMRLAPIAIFYSGDLEQCMYYARESSYTTHPGHIAAECCALLAFLIAQAINDPALPVADMEDFSARRWLEMQIDEYLRTVLGERTGDGVDQVRQLLQSNEPEVCRPGYRNGSSVDMSVHVVSESALFWLFLRLRRDRCREIGTGALRPTMVSPACTSLVIVNC